MPRLSQNRPDQHNKGEPTPKTYTTEHPREFGLSPKPTQVQTEPATANIHEARPRAEGREAGCLTNQEPDYLSMY